MESVAAAQLYPGDTPTSVVRAVAYIGALRLRDDRTGTLHNFTRRRLSENPEVLATAMYAGKSSDEDPGVFWNAVRRHNTHHNAVAGRPLIVAICSALTRSGMWRCLSIFARYLRRKYRVAVFVGLHGPKYGEMTVSSLVESNTSAGLHNSNYHGHLMLTYCTVDRDGGLGNKEPRLDPISCDRLKSPHLFRVEGPAWMAIQNAQLAIEGSSTRLTFHPDPARGELPLKHMGAAVAAMERRGIRTRVGDKNRRIIERNAAERRRRSYVERMERIIAAMEAVSGASPRFGGGDARRTRRLNWATLMKAARSEIDVVVDERFGVIAFGDGSAVVMLASEFAVINDRAECRVRALVDCLGLHPFTTPNGDRERHLEVIRQGIAQIDRLGASNASPVVTWRSQFQMSDHVTAEDDLASLESGTSDDEDLIRYERELQGEIDEADAAASSLDEQEQDRFESSQAQAIDDATAGGGAFIADDERVGPSALTDDGDV